MGREMKHSNKGRTPLVAAKAAMSRESRAFGETVLDALIEAGAPDEFRTRKAAGRILLAVEEFARPGQLLKERDAETEKLRLEEFVQSIDKVERLWRFLAYERYGYQELGPFWISVETADRMKEVLAVLAAARQQACDELKSPKLLKGVELKKLGGRPPSKNRRRTVAMACCVSKLWHSATGKWPSYSGSKGETRAKIFELIKKRLGLLDADEALVAGILEAKRSPKTQTAKVKPGPTKAKRQSGSE
jgi:hypothetical protein